MADDFDDFDYDVEDDFGYDDADGIANDIDQVPDDGGEGEASRDNSPFYTAAGLLILIFLLSLLCGGISYATRSADNQITSDRNAEHSEEIAAIETQNAIIEVTNAAVTQTIIAMETEEAATPTLPPTNTPLPKPTDTPVPTSTPLFQETTANADNSGANGGSNADGTAGADSSSNTGASTGNLAGTPTPISGLSNNGGNGSGTLPQTGIGAWAAALVALGLIGLLIGARKIRHVS